jgi:hypothetical protein
MRVIAGLAVAATVAFSTYACGSNAPSTAGNLRLMIKDSPYSDAKSLLVTFSEVTVHRAESDWTALPFAAPDAATSAPTSRTCDLKKLVDAQDILGVGNLQAGHYTMLRLVVSSATLYFDTAADGPACAPTIAAPAGRSASVTIPSGEVKLNRQFELTTEAKTILVDFDGDRSVVETGNGGYRMTPVIAIVSVE